MWTRSPFSPLMWRVSECVVWYCVLLLLLIVISVSRSDVQWCHLDGSRFHQNSSASLWCQASRTGTLCNLPSPGSFHKHTLHSLFAHFICFHCCVCVFSLSSSSSHLCSLIVFRFNHSLFLGLVSFLVLSFHPPPPPHLWGLVFCSCHGSFHVSLAGRNCCVNTQEERTKQTDKQQPENRCRVAANSSVSLLTVWHWKELERKVIVQHSEISFTTKTLSLNGEPRLHTHWICRDRRVKLSYKLALNPNVVCYGWDYTVVSNPLQKNVWVIILLIVFVFSSCFFICSTIWLDEYDEIDWM